MINITELRIGNIVNYDFVSTALNGPHRLTRDDFEGLLEHKTDEILIIHPIPLSAEILEKARFQRLPGTIFVYRIFVKDFEISVSAELNYVYIDTQWGQASIKYPIVKYLHQLQNLYFALTGEELPVEL